MILLRVVKAAQRLGFSLDEVAELLGVGRPRRPGTADVRSRAVTKLAEVEGRIADLRVVAGTLRAAVDAGCADLVACATSVECPIPFDAPSGRGQLGGRRAGPVSVGRR